MERDAIIREIQSLAKRDGKPPGMARFTAATRIGRHEWYGVHWARWGDALRDAGFSPNQFTEARPEDELLAIYLGVTLEFGRLPTDGELRLRGQQIEGFPGHTTFRLRLGPKQQLLRKLLAYATERGVPDEIRAAISSAIKPDEADDTEQDSGKVAIVGYVYMLKSGRNYKIGKAVAPDRRRYEIGLQLPEKAEPIHSIETDDPSGIEAYWHNRFKDKRLNGEWFDLTRDDVRAFKRRKFM